MRDAASPRSVDRNPRFASPEKNLKIRSDSSPAKMVSPGMKSPSHPEIPGLFLPSSAQKSSDPTSPGSDEPTRLQSSEPVLRSPRKKAPGSTRVRFSDTPASGGSVSAPTTPRSKSTQATEQVPSPIRHRIDSSPRKRASLHATDEDGKIKPAQRLPDRELIMLGEELAACIFDELMKTHPRLNESDIKSLARTDIKLPWSSLSPALRARIDDDSSGKVSHGKLIKALFLPVVLDSHAGKMMKTMRRLAMEQYDGYALTIADRERIEEESPGFKKRLQDNINGHGIAAVQVTLGLNGAHIGRTALPAELIAFWTAIDRRLQAVAAKNAALDSQLVMTARANLGFDVLFTRLLLPIATGANDESHLVIPQMFFAAVKDAALVQWPAFTASFFAQVAATEALATAAPTTTSATTDAVLVSSVAVSADDPTSTEKS
jgi:hypothetical protein